MKGSPAHRMGSRPVHPTGQRPINPTGRGVLVYVLLVYTGFMVFFRLSYLGWSPSASDGAVPGAPHRRVPSLHERDEEGADLRRKTGWAVTNAFVRLELTGQTKARRRSMCV